MLCDLCVFEVGGVWIEAALGLKEHAARAESWSCPHADGASPREDVTAFALAWLLGVETGQMDADSTSLIRGLVMLVRPKATPVDPAD